MDRSAPGLSPGLRELCRAEASPAVSLVARAMRDNPVHEAVFGAPPAHRERRLRRFFGRVMPLVLDRGVVIGAHHGNELLGLVGMLPPGACRITPVDALRIAPSLFTADLLSRILRIRRWQRVWRRN